MKVRWNQFFIIIFVIILMIDYTLIGAFDLVGLWAIIITIFAIWRLNEEEKPSD